VNFTFSIFTRSPVSAKSSPPYSPRLIVLYSLLEKPTFADVLNSDKYRDRASPFEFAHRDRRAPSPEAIMLNSDDDEELAKAIQRSLEDVQPSGIPTTILETQHSMGSDGIYEAEKHPEAFDDDRETALFAMYDAEDMMMTDAGDANDTQKPIIPTKHNSELPTDKPLSDSGISEMVGFQEEGVALFCRFKELPRLIRKTIWVYSYNARLIEVLERNGE
jgi:hypothetical protein